MYKIKVGSICYLPYKSSDEHDAVKDIKSIQESSIPLPPCEEGTSIHKESQHDQGENNKEERGILKSMAAGVPGILSFRDRLSISEALLQSANYV